MSREPFALVGLGDDGLDGLRAPARNLLERATCLIGARRHLELVASLPARKVPLERDLSQSLALIDKERRQGALVVLASGDPLTYGLGVLCLERFGAEVMNVVPHVSAATLACARLGWNGAQVELLSVCGRPVASLIPHLASGRRLIVYAADRKSPAAVARLLCSQGFAPSLVYLLAHLDGVAEQQAATTARALADGHAPLADVDLICLGLELKVDRVGAGMPLTPGLEDETFAHDGQLTRREARALALSALAPRRGERLVDFGAGAGSVAIEWLLQDGQNSALAIERDPLRCERIKKNADALGVSRLQVRNLSNHEGLDAVATSEAVFIGGGLDAELLRAVIERLQPGARLLVHAVTLPAETLLMDAFMQHGGKLTRSQITRASKLGNTFGWRPAMPLTQWLWVA